MVSTRFLTINWQLKFFNLNKFTNDNRQFSSPDSLKNVASFHSYFVLDIFKRKLWRSFFSSYIIKNNKYIKKYKYFIFIMIIKPFILFKNYLDSGRVALKRLLRYIIIEKKTIDSIKLVSIYLLTMQNYWKYRLWKIQRIFLPSIILIIMIL